MNADFNVRLPMPNDKYALQDLKMETNPTNKEMYAVTVEKGGIYQIGRNRKMVYVIEACIDQVVGASLF